MRPLGDDDVRVLDATRGVVEVPAGTLVSYRGLGIILAADYNEPQFRSQPLVIVSTLNIDPRFAGGDRGPDIAIHVNDWTLFDGSPSGPPSSAPACTWRRRRAASR